MNHINSNEKIVNGNSEGVRKGKDDIAMAVYIWPCELRFRWVPSYLGLSGKDRMGEVKD